MTLSPALKWKARAAYGNGGNPAGGGAPRLVEPTATRRAGERVARFAASGRSSEEATRSKDVPPSTNCVQNSTSGWTQDSTPRGCEGVHIRRGVPGTEAAMIIHPHEVMRDFARPKIRNRVAWHKRRHWWTGRDYYLLAGWIIAAAVVIPVWLWVLIPAIRAVIRMAY